MKTDCLNERDLILLHYGEALDGMTPEAAAGHLADCASCRMRREQLARELARIPASAGPDPLAATRIAARVSERLHAKRPWLPLAGTVVAGTAALTMALVVFVPDTKPPTPDNPPLITGLQQPVAGSEELFVGPPSPAIRQATLDLDLLDNLDLLEELETLRALEGV